MRVLVCGSREWSDHATIEAYIEKLPQDTVVVHGAAPGADTIAAKVASRIGLKTEPHPALWNIHGRRAGPLRNQEMLDSGVDQVIAFRLFGHSPGTDDMVRRAWAAHVPTTVVMRHPRDAGQTGERRMPGTEPETPHERCARLQLVSAAARAEELFETDDLERFAMTRQEAPGC